MKALGNVTKLLICVAILNVGHVAAKDLTVTVSGINEIKGAVNVAVYNSAQSLKRYQAWRTMTIPATARSVSVVLPDVPDGEYGFMVYHDVDSNGKLGRNFIGIPNEPYGFSNDPRLMGPPNFEQLAIKVTQNRTNVALTLR
ncbi:hypothetical protein PA25_07790 [Pseudoalteromonas sp. A25]|uniref:DUF2141 domain-containing protein n=1 Tax=Pseudoalteromonas sp. A25 TaxID=116092 RepID=UPI001260998D|nr:DUF2141 domain-containing protein [Pseudoalteromonas sp. A25]BBN80794.1 hypothetical protein PA25_07790 [Pseudoalteromonas sp. A25]